MKSICRLLIVIILPLFVQINTDIAAATVVPAPPKINSTSYLVMDYHSGELLVAENIDKRVEPASLTKMMTVYIAAGELVEGNITLEDMVEVSEKAWRMGGSRMFIEVGKKVSVADLLKGVIIQSGNDASIALAEYIAGGEDVFAELMNQHAARLGMQNTHFTNSTGLPHENHYTTAGDLAVLARALIRDFPEIYTLHGMKKFTFNGITQRNRNKMLWRDDSVDGIKTGHTESAGYCLVASARRGDMRLISVVMGAGGEEIRAKATQSIMNYGFRFYETHKLYSAHEAITTARIWKGDTEETRLGVADDLYITIPRGRRKQVDTTTVLENKIIAPVNRGDVQGTVKISLEGKKLADRPLIVLQKVNEGSLFHRLKDELLLLFE